MHWIDGLVVGAYLLATLALGRWLTRRVRDSEDFFLAGRSLPFWAIGMSLVVSDIGALEMVGGTANAYLHGIGQANFEWYGCVPAMIVGGLVFVPIYWRSGVYSVPEYLGARYGSTVRTIQAVIWTTFLAAGLAVFFQAAAAMFLSTFGWAEWFSIAVTAIVVSVYSVGGGLRAVVITDVVQCVILFIGGLLLAWVGLDRVGGLSGLEQALAEIGEPAAGHLEIVDSVAQAGQPQPAFPWTGVLLGLGFVLSPAYWIGNQAIVQRVLAAKDEWSARAAMVFAAGLKTIVPLAFVLPGMLGLALFGLGEDAEQVYPKMVVQLLPVGARGILFAAFLAALMSSVDSYTNSASTVFVRDIYRRLPGVRLGDQRELLIGRVCSLVIIGVGVALVPVVRSYQSIYEAFQQFLTYFQGPTLALLLLGFCWRGATPRAGLWGFLGGVSFAVAADRIMGVNLLHAAFWSFLLTSGAIFVLSWCTPKLDAASLDRLVLGRAGKENN